MPDVQQTRVAVAGATGYTGIELANILRKHSSMYALP